MAACGEAFPETGSGLTSTAPGLACGWDLNISHWLRTGRTVKRSQIVAFRPLVIPAHGNRHVIDG